ncbi:MAG: HEAT repeat domain-containing protein [Thermoanaerobaculia bacterium]
MRNSLLILVGLVVLSSWATAEPPDFLNSEITFEQAGTNLGSSVDSLLQRGSDTRWIAWSVPAVEGHRYLCCWGRGDRLSQRGACSLESRDRHFVMSDGHDLVTPPEVREIAVLLRADGSRVEEVRVYSETCRLDAGGRAVTWVESVTAEQSVAWLTTLIGRGRSDDLSEEALMALALHKGSAADRELATIASSESSSSLREEAIFWLGEARGQAGLEVLDRLLDTKRDADIKVHIAFALTLSSAPGAMERLTTLGRTDPDPEVRGEALFWLAQEGGAGAADAVKRAVDSDPDREVREQAIFALSQLPDGQGTDLLLEIVRDPSQDVSVRQEALFWLAQSEDDRALDLISDILQK